MIALPIVMASLSGGIRAWSNGVVNRCILLVSKGMTSVLMTVRRPLLLEVWRQRMLTLLMLMLWWEGSRRCRANVVVMVVMTLC